MRDIERSLFMLEGEPLLLAAEMLVEPSAADPDLDLPKGADVSFHQREIDWPAARRDGVTFCFIRWGQRDEWFDSRARFNWIECGKTPIFRGAYWVWDEREGADAEAHFQAVLEQASRIGLDHYDGELPLVVDLELEPVDWDELEAFLVRLEGWMGRQPIIYTGSWFYSRIAPLPDWLADYEHWLTGYNDEGPSIWGPLADLDPEVICWQQANNWQVGWAELGAVDRNYWWAGTAHLLEMANMADKVVKLDDLIAWLQSNAYDAIPVPGGPSEFRLAWPAPPPIVVTQRYGINPQFYPGQKGHEGIDIRAPNGTPVLAAADGQVYRVENDPESGPYGMQVRIEHPHPSGPFKTVYAHLMSIIVNEGQLVATGDSLGIADNTGNSSGAHLHLTLKKKDDGSTWLGMDDIVNPTPYLSAIFPGSGPWLVDVAGNLRSTPEVADNLIRLIRPGEFVWPSGLFTGDWWELRMGGQSGWFWEPGYKLQPAQ